MQLILGDCLDKLKTIPSNSVDSLVTDPPAGIAFMGKDWDKNKGGRDSWIDWLQKVMVECVRVLKPGAHGLIWAIPRTSHWTATALENAGFEIRDVITHLFGSGFPKSLNVTKKGADSVWDGWGTALKPASEHWILVRKPIAEKNIVENIFKYGVGAINIDASRIDSETLPKPCSNNNIRNNAYASDNSNRVRDTMYIPNLQGRFPTNVILDEDAAILLDEQSGILKSGKMKAGTKRRNTEGYAGSMPGVTAKETIGDSGGASRFFYVAKASKADKGRENKHPTVKATKLMAYLVRLVTPAGGIVLDPFMGSGSTGVAVKRLGLNFIGIEQDNMYYTIAKDRINAIDTD